MQLINACNISNAHQRNETVEIWHGVKYCQHMKKGTITKSYPHTGVQMNPGGSSKYYVSLSLSVSLSGHPRCFLYIIRVAHNFVQRMRPQATGYNPLSFSIICFSVYPPGHLCAFCNFFICINFQCGVPES